MPPLPPPDLVTQHRFPGLQDGGGGAAVPAEGEAAGGAVQRYFQNVHKHTYLKGRYDAITSVGIPLALAALQLVPHRKRGLQHVPWHRKEGMKV
uniref:Uncharacterized protein n=1 Tax=Saccharum hybrid cultivar R570 TaxID=131158 RepID=A0A059Q3A5_9POAL|nr:hypothetical protein SHCRBa_028_K15_R_30 [Saccharum hybrid cultivar R570]